MRRGHHVDEGTDIEVIDLELLDLGGPASAVRLQTSGARVDDWWRRIRHQYAIVVAANRGIGVRRHSRVERRLDVPVEVLVEHLRGVSQLTVEGGSIQLRDATSLYDDVEHMHLVPARLAVAWSWPRVPVWLTAARYSPTTSILGLQLRSHHRVRYPTRYFHVAHRVLATARDDLVRTDAVAVV